MRQSTFPRSGVLVVGANYIRSLLPSTLRSQAESLLDSHRIEDAIGLADQQRKKLESKLTVDDDESEELCYVYQRIGFQCLSETLFEDAGNNFFAGDLDPRALISYYPDLRGSLFSETDTLDIYAGVAEHMPRQLSIDEIIMANLVRNYSPHLDTRAEPSTAELRKVLGMAAREMLEKFLRKWRKKREVNGKGVGGGVSTVDEVVDTVIAKIFAEEGKTADLHTLLRGPNYVRQAELEPVLTRTGRYSALCVLYEVNGEDGKLLDAWSKVAEGDWMDNDIADPLSSMFTFLMEKHDRKLTQQWGIWLIKRDTERALKLLTSRDMSKRRERPEDDLLMLQQVTDADPAAGVQFLEHLVLQKRSLTPDLHMRLANSCIDQLLACTADASTSKLWRAKASSYASSRTNTSFLSYFASTTPDSEHKRVRLKTALFLQGSALYEPEPIKKRLMEHQKVLQLEVAIVDGKLGHHRAALSILVHDLRDATSAEAYCTLGGEVVPGKIAQAIGGKYGLRQWSSALFSLPTSAAMSRTTSTATTAASEGSTAALMTRQKSSVDEGVKKDLLEILLEVYMNDGESERTAHLLNSQAMNLDVVDVIPLVPSDWSLSIMSSFLARSFRRTLHAKHEGQIVKAISSGQNLEVTDSSWLILREQGAIIEEADDDGESGVDTEVKFDEKDVLVEKIGLHLQDIDIGAGMDISNAADNDGGTRKEIRRGESETDPPMLK